MHLAKSEPDQRFSVIFDPQLASLSGTTASSDATLALVPNLLSSATPSKKELASPNPPFLRPPTSSFQHVEAAYLPEVLC